MRRLQPGLKPGHGWRLGMLGMAVLACVIALSGCDLGAGGTSGGGTTPAATGTTGLTSALATLVHQPVGTADLTYNPSAKTLNVKVNLTGLAPNSDHAAHIHNGSCGSSGSVVHALNTITANGKGVASLDQTIDNVSSEIPGSGWDINVHNGTGTDQYSSMSIACANIKPQSTSTSAGQTQTAHVTFGDGEGPSQAASGKATLAIQGGKLLVTITMSGLEPTSKHAAHIHTGTCASQGDIVHPLNDVTADGSGNATSTTTIDNVSAIPSGGWYVNVHRGTNMNSPIDFDPIACGNVSG